jgi:hypothetical protein
MGVEATLAGFTEFIRTVMAVPVDALADDSIYIPMAYWPAQTLTNDNLYIVGNVEAPPPQTQPTIRALAVYNLAGALLIDIAQDDPTAPPPDDTYWSTLRASMGLNGFSPGVVQSAADQGTSTGYKVSSFFDNLTPGELQLVKSPWGRMYLTIASWYGPTIWGLT